MGLRCVLVTGAKHQGGGSKRVWSTVIDSLALWEVFERRVCGLQIGM